MGIADHPSGLRVRAERNILRQTPRQVYALRAQRENKSVRRHPMDSL